MHLKHFTSVMVGNVFVTKVCIPIKPTRVLERH